MSSGFIPNANSLFFRSFIRTLNCAAAVCHVLSLLRELGCKRQPGFVIYEVLTLLAQGNGKEVSRKYLTVASPVVINVI